METFEVTHGFVDVVLIRCMMSQFCCRLHGKGCVPGKVLTKGTKVLVCIARTMSWNYEDDSVKSLLFLDNEYAIDKYKWESRWNTQLNPSASCAIFPVSFWASDTLKQH
jgi:hypothetical protein